MTILRASTLYLTNTVTVDTGTGIDVRALRSTNGTTDSTQSIAVTTQGSNAERTFDPATASTATNNAATTLAKLGYAVPLASMTDGDANCTTVLNAQTVTVNFVGGASGTGTGNVGANDVLTPRASLWKYNTSTDTATLIVGGSGTAVTIFALVAYSNTGFTAAVSLSVPQTTFGANEVLYLQLGGNLACGAGLLGGARTTTWVLSVDISTTNIAMTQGLVKACTNSANIVGSGVVSRALAGALSRSAVGAGVATGTKATIASKTFNLVGAGVVTFTKSTQAVRSFNLVGSGVVTRKVAVALSRLMTGAGVPTYSRSVVAAKTTNLVGVGTVSRQGLILVLLERTVTGSGVITNTHPVQAFRTFSLTGVGVVLKDGPNASTITLPIDEIPTDGGTTIVIRKRVTIYDKA